MNWFSGILVYVIAWWLFFFMMLPIGVRAQNEDGGEVVPGTVESAPKNPNLLKKALGAGILAAISLALFFWMAESGLIDFRNPG
ncbi:MAG: DUF1467 family protein [Sphingomonadales bacterium]